MLNFKYSLCVGYFLCSGPETHDKRSRKKERKKVKERTEEKKTYLSGLFVIIDHSVQARQALENF